MLSFSVGDRVSQRTYGEGTVTASNEYHIVIDFDDHGSRTFSSALVQLERSNSKAPERPKGKTRRTKSTKTSAASRSE